MPLSAGSRLGPYEIISRLGAGGMGDVWKARDTRLGREVAIKVLPEDLASDGERLKRFEREARAVSSLSHPNIVTVYEIERLGSTPVIVMELVIGETLRELLEDGPLPMRRVLQIAPQIADGLARAHSAGIVHRDLKPENVMVTRDGLVKILDFGLAKLTHPEQDSGRAPIRSTISAATTPGIAMGTVAYMSPEQALGHVVDYRSDQFSFGSVLYEMAAGRQAFHGASVPQTLTTIIEEEPEPIGAAAPRTPPPLRWIIERCLSKEAKGRYASTEDLAQELAKLRDRVSELSSSTAVEIEPARRRPRWRAIALGAAGLAALAGMFLLGDRMRRARISEPRFRQLTFRGGGIGTARFAPDGQTIVFSSQTEGRPPELFSMRLDSPETRSLGLPPAQIMSISRSGEMAILLLPAFALTPRIGHLVGQILFRDPFLFAGTVAEASLSGGAPRELLEDVSFADWSSDGTSLAVVHRVGNRNRVEFPVGHAIRDVENEWLNHPRVHSRDGRVAFKDFEVLFFGKAAALIPGDRTGLEETHWEIAWPGGGAELWFTEAFPPAYTDIRAQSEKGTQRLVARLPGDFVLYDCWNQSVLLGRLVESWRMLGSLPGETGIRDLSYFASSQAEGLSADGTSLLFSDVSQNFSGAAYIRRVDGSAPKRLAGDVWPISLSADGRFALTGSAYADPNAQLMVIPTGAGQPRALATGGIEIVYSESRRPSFLPDGKRVIYSGYEKGHGRRVWVQNLDGGRPRAISPEGTTRPIPVGNGSFVCARGPDFEWRMYPVDAGEPRKVVGVLPGEEPIQSSPEGLLYVRGPDELKPGETLMTTRVYRLDPATGRRELWKEIAPASTQEGGAIENILFSADGKTCVWTHIRYSTELVLVEGLR